MGRAQREKHIWLYGRHACVAALQNSRRVCHELVVSRRLLGKHSEVLGLAKSRRVPIREAETQQINVIFGNETVNQGVALKVDPLFGNAHMEDVLSGIRTKDTSTVVVLDEVTDVHNVGAILRSAACFNVDALVITKHNSPTETAAMAKASSGAIDLVPVVCVANLVQALQHLRKHGYWCYGFDMEGDKFLNEISFCKRRIVILGAEGKGLRRLTKENCDYLIRIPMSERMDSLNVSNAAAIAMYSAYIQSEK